MHGKRGSDPGAKKKPAPKRGFRGHDRTAMDQPRSCSSAALKVALGRIALLASVSYTHLTLPTILLV